MVKEIRIYVPDEVYRRLKKIEFENKITIQDLLLRAIIKVIEEFEGEIK